MSGFFWGWFARDLYSDSDSSAGGCGCLVGSIIVFVVIASIFKFLGEVTGVTAERLEELSPFVVLALDYGLSALTFLPYWDVYTGFSDGWSYFGKAAFSFVNILSIVILLVIINNDYTLKIENTLFNKISSNLSVFLILTIIFIFFVRIPYYLFLFLIS